MLKDFVSLRHRLVKQAAIIVIVMVIVTTLLRLAYFSVESNFNFESRLNRIGEDYASLLANPMANEDEKEVNLILKTLASTPAIYFAQVYIDGDEFASYGKTVEISSNTSSVTHSVYFKPSAEDLDPVYVGKLLLEGTHVDNTHLIARSFIQFAIEGLILAGLIIAALIYKSRALYGDGLDRLIKQINKHVDKKEKRALEWTMIDEIGVLVNQFNQLLNQNAETESRLTEAEQYHRQQSAIAKHEAVAAQKKAIESLLRYQSIYEKAINGLFSTDINYKFQTANPALAQMFGFDSTDALFKDTPTVLSRIDPSTNIRQEVESQMQEKGYVTNIEVQLTRKNGDNIWCALSMQEIPKNEDQNYIEGSLVDISERKAKEIAEKESKAASMATEAKSAFLANMSHEIRTPLTAILGYSELLLENEFNEEKIERIHTVIRCSKHLLGIIDDILDVSKIEANKLEVEVTDFNLLEALNDITNAFEQKAIAKGLEFNIKYQWPLPMNIQSDPTRLKQILFNLLGNALKFTKEGHIGFDVMLDPAEEKLKISVSDTGIGLSKEKLAKLFNPFTQADSSTTRLYGGTGLGLHISKKLAQMLGGDIAVQSIAGVGTRFTVTIAIQAFGDLELIDSEEEAGISLYKKAHETEIPSLKGNVLLTEDNLDNQALIDLFLQGTGLNVKIANNGKMAVNIVEKYGLDYFGLVLMDIQMPVLNGIQATEKLRNMGFTNPIVALTANVMKEEVDLYLSKGFTAHLAKPIVRERLYEELGHHFEQCEGPSSDPKPKASKKVSQTQTEAQETEAKFTGQVLLAEENDDNLSWLKVILERYNLNVEPATDGQVAYDMANNNPYDLIILNRNLPNLDGVKACKKLNKNGISTPVYLLTADTSEEILESFFECGCAGYLEKPIDETALYHSLKKHLKSHSKPREDEEVVKTSVTDPGMVPLIQNFLKRLPKQVAEGRTALAKSDWGSLKISAHTLKGTGGSFGYPGLTERAKSVENAVIDHQYEQLDELYTELERYSQKMIDAGV